MLSIGGKVLCSIIRKRITSQYESAVSDEQAGFRTGRGCNDQIFALRQTIENRLRHSKPMLAVFVDFAAAFDSVHRESMWRVLHQAGIPLKLCNVLRNLYSGAASQVRIHGELTEPFAVNTGVRQGCILSPALFVLSLNWIMSKLRQDFPGIQVNNELTLSNLSYADDIVLLAENEDDAQSYINALSQHASKLGLRINSAKTKVMAVAAPPPLLHLDGVPLEVVPKFKYLGATISNDVVAGSADILDRIGKATQSFACLHNAVWSRTYLSIKTKMRIFNAAVIPVLLYGAESWCLLEADARMLEVFQMRCLRKILGVSLLERLTNVSIQRKCLHQPDIKTQIRKARLRWAGHVLRMDPTRIVRQSWIYKVPPDWKCPPKAPKKTWSKMVQQDLAHLASTYGSVNWHNNYINIIADLAQDRNQWKQITHVASYGSV